MSDAKSMMQDTRGPAVLSLCSRTSVDQEHNEHGQYKAKQKTAANMAKEEAVRNERSGGGAVKREHKERTRKCIKTEANQEARNYVKNMSK